MTPTMTPEKMIEVIVGAQQGKTIQWRDKDVLGPRWRFCENPIWDFSEFDYQIAPEPKYKVYSVIGGMAVDIHALQDLLEILDATHISTTEATTDTYDTLREIRNLVETYGEKR